MARKRLDGRDVPPGMSLTEGSAYLLFAQKLGPFRSHRLLGVAIVVVAFLIVGWLIFLNHAD